MGNFWIFITSVFNQWFELLSGCVLVTMIALFEKFVRELPKKIYTFALIAIFFWACFGAWNEQYEANSKARDCQNQITEKDKEIRTLKDSKIVVDAELSTVREAKNTLERQLNDKIVEVQSLRESIKIAQASVLNPIIQSAIPTIFKDRSGTWLLFQVHNIGRAPATLTKFESIIFIGGKQYGREVKTEPVTMNPSSLPIHFTIRLPDSIQQDLKENRTKLRAIVKFQYKDIFEKETPVCISWEEPSTHEDSKEPKECTRGRVSSPVKATLPMENFGLQGWFDTWRAAGLPTPHEAAPRCNSGAIPQ